MQTVKTGHAQIFICNNIFAEISLPKSVYSVTYFNHLSHVNQQRQIDTFSHNVNISLPTLHFLGILGNSIQVQHIRALGKKLLQTFVTLRKLICSRQVG